MTSSRPTDTTLGELRASGYRPRSVKEEMRGNLLDKIRSGDPLLPGILGYEETVLPQIENAILAGQDMILLGERGQALLVGCVAEPDRHALEQALRDARREQRLAARDHAHRPDEVLGLGVLHEEAARACPHRARHVLVELERRQHHDA